MVKHWIFAGSLNEDFLSLWKKMLEMACWRVCRHRGLLESAKKLWKGGGGLANNATGDVTSWV